MVVLCLAVPEPVGMNRLVQTGLPECYRDFMSTVGVGVTCNAWRMRPTERLRTISTTRSRSMVSFARSLQGDDYAVCSDGAVWQLQDPDEPAFVWDSLSGWLEAWMDGSADQSIRNPWFVPDRAKWNQSELHVLTADEHTNVIDLVVRSLPDAVELTRIDGPLSVQSHLWWAQTWVVATAVAASITRADWDLDLRLRTEADVGAKVSELAVFIDDHGWLSG